MVSLPLLTDFQMGSAAMQLVEQRAWDSVAYDIQYHLGVDGLSVPLIVLTTLVGALVLVGAWAWVNKQVAQYYASLMDSGRRDDRRVLRAGLDKGSTYSSKPC